MLRTALALLSALSGYPAVAAQDRDVRPAETRASSAVSQALASGDALELRYFDPFYERRSPLEVGNIDEVYDFAVNVRCSGITCLTALPWVASLLADAKPSKTPCEGAKHMRVNVNFEGRTADTMYLDRTGTCLWYRGGFLRVKNDVINAVRTRPLSKW